MINDLIIPLMDKEPIVVYVDFIFDGGLLYDIVYEDILPNDFSHPHLACSHFLIDFSILISDLIDE